MKSRIEQLEKEVKRLTELTDNVVNTVRVKLKVYADCKGYQDCTVYQDFCLYKDRDKETPDCTSSFTCSGYKQLCREFRTCTAYPEDCVWPACGERAFPHDDKCSCIACRK